MEAITEAEIKREFDKIMSKHGIGRKLGLSKHDVYHLRQPGQSVKNMLHVLFLAKKLTLYHGFETTEPNAGGDT